MTRVHIEAHMFSCAWFNTVLNELEKAKTKVRFSYCPVKKMKGEMEAVKNAAIFYKLMNELGRCDIPEVDQTNRAIEVLQDNDVWCSCSACDDPHVFALVRAKPTPFIFSKDKRMAKCRGKISGSIEKEYCKFRVISSDAVYRVHRAAILK